MAAAVKTGRRRAGAPRTPARTEAFPTPGPEERGRTGHTAGEGIDAAERGDRVPEFVNTTRFLEGTEPDGLTNRRAADRMTEMVEKKKPGTDPGGRTA